ncbi:hypothetical protein CRE_08731 [Caenorhabditis remanei]|uniref:Uncharacterized protein n=1 Tax=Caenorhabditis remanei TaxID=31234 RepID=E3LJL9_CAERE|nr:hypothetical protein CRE_08731 [Caenorhabditis remanei]
MAEEEAQVAVDVAEPVEVETKFQFLQSRQRLNSDSEYHSTHDKNSLADIPDVLDRSLTEEEPDRECHLMKKPESRVSSRQMRRLKTEITHLPFDTVMKILAYYHYNIDIAIAAAKQMSTPQLLPKPTQALFKANIPYEREQNPTKKQPYKEFYMAKKFRKVADNKTLVDFYYNEKNKIDGNWRLERDDRVPMTSEERVEMQERMASCGIYIRRRDPTATNRKTRGKKAAATRKANQLLRMDNGDFRDEDGADSDTPSDRAASEKSEMETPTEPAPMPQITLRVKPYVSPPTITVSTSPDASHLVASSGASMRSPVDMASESSISTPPSTSAPSSSEQPRPRLTFRFQFADPIFNRSANSISPVTSSSSSSSTTSDVASTSGSKVKKVYRKKTIEELRGGEQKTYPDRERKPKKRLYE